MFDQILCKDYKLNGVKIVTSANCPRKFLAPPTPGQPKIMKTEEF